MKVRPPNQCSNLTAYNEPACNDANNVAIVTAGGIPAIVAAMHNYPHDVNLNTVGCHALAALAGAASQHGTKCYR